MYVPSLGADPIGPNVMHQLSSPILHAHAPTRNSMNNTCDVHGIGRADLPSGGTQRRVGEMLNWSAILLDPWLALSLLTRITRRMRNSWWTALLGNVPTLFSLSVFSLENRSSQLSLQIGLKKETFSTSNGRATTWGELQMLPSSPYW